MRELMPQLPGSELACRLRDTVFRLAEDVESALGEKVKCKWQTGHAVGQDAIPDVATGREIAS